MTNNDSLQTIIISLTDSLNQLMLVKGEPTIIIVKDTIVNEIGLTNGLVEPLVTNPIDLNISALLTLGFIGLGVGLYFLLSFLKKYILPVFTQRYKKVNIKLFWYRFTTIIWASFGLLSLYIFLKSSILITCLILSFSGLLFHQFIIDFFLGIYFRFENNIKTNDYLILEDTEGEIQDFASCHLHVLTTKNQDIYILYRHLLKAPIKIVKQVDSLLQKSFVLQMEGEPYKNLEKLNQSMTLCPWVFDSKLYKITHTDQNNYKISVRVKEDFTANKIEAFISSKIK